MSPSSPREIEGIQESPSALISYLLKDPVFEELYRLKREGWENQKADAYWQKRKFEAQYADNRAQEGMFKMMRRIGSQLNRQTGAFALPAVPDDAPAPAVLDLTLASGGFSSCVLSLNARCQIDAFTLPEEDGGLVIRVAPDPRLTVTKTDITMLASELGMQPRDVPEDSPNAEKLRASVWPYGSRQYGLVIADGKVPDGIASGGTGDNSGACAHGKALALRAAQFALALTKLQPGGTLVMLCFRSAEPRRIRTMHMLSKMCDSVEMFKPEPWHAIKSTFYVVAKGVRTQSEECRRMVDENLDLWRRAVVFGDGDGDGDGESEKRQWFRDGWYVTDEEVLAIIGEFGEEFKKMARPVWRVQIRAMRRKWRALGCEASESDVASPRRDEPFEKRSRIMGLGSWRKND